MTKRMEVLANEVSKWLELNQKIYCEYATRGMPRVETVPRGRFFFRFSCLAKIKILLTFALTASVFWCAKGHRWTASFFFPLPPLRLPILSPLRFFLFFRTKRTDCNYRSLATCLCLSEREEDGSFEPIEVLCNYGSVCIDPGQPVLSCTLIGSEFLEERNIRISEICISLVKLFILLNDEFWDQWNS